MKKLLILSFLVLSGCAAPGVEAERSQVDECERIAVELADTVKHLRTVAHDPSPERVDMAIEQARDFEECMSDRP